MGISTAPATFPDVTTYYVACNAYGTNNNPRCSGNPWCTYIVPGASPKVDCNISVDCGPADLITVTVNPLPPVPDWWQTKDGDIVGSVISNPNLLAGQFLSLAGAGGYPGVAIYSGSIDNSSSISQTYNWLANTAYTSLASYTYVFFERQIENNVLATEMTINISDNTFVNSGTAFAGYKYYKYIGGPGRVLSIGALALANDKVVLLATGFSEVDITGAIGLNDGTGFFGLITDSPIKVMGTVGGAGFDL